MAKYVKEIKKSDETSYPVTVEGDDVLVSV